MFSRKPLALLLFLLTITLSVAPPTIAADAETAGGSGAKMIPYNAGYMVFHIPESMRLNRYTPQITRLPRINNDGRDVDVLFTEVKFEDASKEEKRFFGDYEVKLHDMRPAVSPVAGLKIREETVGGIFQQPARMCSYFQLSRYKGRNEEPLETSELTFDLRLKLPQGYLNFTETFSRKIASAETPLDNAFKEEKIKEFLEVVKTYVSAYKWTYGGTVVNNSAFKTRFGEIDTAHGLATPGFNLHFIHSRQLVRLHIHSNPGLDELKRAMQKAFKYYDDKEKINASGSLPFISFKPRAVAGLDGYELIVARGPAISRAKTWAQMNLHWTEAKRLGSKTPQVDIDMEIFLINKDQDLMKSYSEMLNIWNAVLDNAQNLAAQ